MGERTDLKVPFRRAAVELCLGGQAARRVELFLAENVDKVWPRQAVLDLLEGDRRFLPCRDIELGTLTLINRDHIMWLAIAPHDLRDIGAESAELGPLFDQRYPVTLQLAGGIKLDGAILYSAPVEHARLADHMNHPGSFLALHWSDQVLLVRKSAVLEIVER
ncbi:MAG TPA: hypothetical protein VNO33_20895 [Kofleriaceae bacterium]|nr:hypothetical protein [Kofleriaceae bacterium]